MSTHLIVYTVLCVLVIGLAVAVIVLGLGRGDLIWFRRKAEAERAKALSQLEDSRAACRQAEIDLYRVAQERDTAVREAAKLLGAGQDDDTVRLPAWHQFLDTQAAHDKSITEQMEHQFHDANGEGR